MLTLTPGNNYFVLVFWWLIFSQTQLTHLTHLFIKNIAFIFMNSVLIEMREKLRS